MFLSIWNQCIDLIFPRRCPICHEIVTPAGDLTCPSCLKKIHFIRSPVCKKCGKEVSNVEKEYCYDCFKHKRSYDYGLSLLRYDELTKSSMAAIKYKNKTEYLDFYSEAIWRYYQKQLMAMNIDIIVPVPIHRKRRRERGFNQAEILAVKIGAFMGLPVVRDGLVRTKNTDPQKKLTSQERLRNLSHAFQQNNAAVAGKRILLVDDIYTTGSTVEACSRALKEGGAANIFVITICIGGGE